MYLKLLAFSLISPLTSTTSSSHFVPLLHALIIISVVFLLILLLFLHVLFSLFIFLVFLLLLLLLPLLHPSLDFLSSTVLLRRAEVKARRWLTAGSQILLKKRFKGEDTGRTFQTFSMAQAPTVWNSCECHLFIRLFIGRCITIDYIPSL